jgi:hypothetical protein
LQARQSFLQPNLLSHHQPRDSSSQLLKHVGEGAGALDLSAALQGVEIIHEQVNVFESKFWSYY